MRGTDESVARGRANALALNTLAQSALPVPGEQTDLFAHTDDDRVRAERRGLLMNETERAGLAALVQVFGDAEGLLGGFSCTEIELLAVGMWNLGEQDLAVGVVLGHVQDCAVDEEECEHEHLLNGYYTQDPTVRDGAWDEAREHVRGLVAGTHTPGQPWPTAPAVS